jgi:hypothetical protein
MFPKIDIKVHSVSNTFGTREAGQSLEERVETQALSVDLREAVMLASLAESPAAGPFWNWLCGLKTWAFAPHVPA